MTHRGRRGRGAPVASLIEISRVLEETARIVREHAEADRADAPACLRYVELNPVRARLASRPEDWRWSSARAHLGLAADSLTDLAAAAERIDDWRAFLDAGLGDEECEAMRAAERLGRLLP